MATFNPQVQPQPQFQTGMTDPYINEVVKYVAELDEEGIRKEIIQPFRFFFIFSLIAGIFCPIFCIMPLIMFCLVRRHCKSTVEGSHVYVTENTLVYIKGGQPIEFSRVTIPLANIASVNVQPPGMLISIKPTAPEVILSRQANPGIPVSDRVAMQTFATRSVPIPHVKNAEPFAAAIREVITK